MDCPPGRHVQECWQKFTNETDYSKYTLKFLLRHDVARTWRRLDVGLVVDPGIDGVRPGVHAVQLQYDVAQCVIVQADEHLDNLDKKLLGSILPTYTRKLDFLERYKPFLDDLALCLQDVKEGRYVREEFVERPRGARIPPVREITQYLVC